MWYDNLLNWKTLVDIYIVWVFVIVVVKLVFTNKKLLGVFFAMIFIMLLRFIADKLGLLISAPFLNYLFPLLPIIILIIFASEFRRAAENIWKTDTSKSTLIVGSEKTKHNIVDAIMQLSSKKIGALITIEKHNILDKFADRAIILDGEVSKELLINIFIPNTPLHDGAVIVRGDRIVCAGAYFILSENDNFDKTMGSRHRAALGISEMSDSLTIIASEETGTVSIAVDGIMLKMNDKDKLMEYINMFMR